jgi:hypothetical protein
MEDGRGKMADGKVQSGETVEKILGVLEIESRARL